MRIAKLTVSALVAATLGASAADAGDGYGDKLIFGSVSSFTLGHRDVSSTDSGSGETLEFGSTSAYNIPIWKSFSMQIDGFSEYYFNTNSNADPKSHNALGLHLSYRNPSKGLIGLFGGYSWTNVKPQDGTKFEMAMVGAEAQLYQGNWTFYVQGGYADVTKENADEQEGFNKGWFARGVARYFFTPNSKLEAEVSYAYANPYIDGGPGGNDDDKGKFVGWGVSLDHKLFNIRDMPLVGGLPVYGTLAYRGARYEATQDPDHATEHVFKAGVKILFGARDLKHNDRNGATLDLPTLPIRANGLAENLD